MYVIRLFLHLFCFTQIKEDVVMIGFEKHHKTFFMRWSQIQLFSYIFSYYCRVKNATVWLKI